MTCTYLAKRLRELSSTKTGSYPHEFLCRTNCSACADYQPCIYTCTLYVIYSNDHVYVFTLSIYTCSTFNIFQVYQYFTIYRRYFVLKFEHFHEYLIHFVQYSLKSGGTKYHFKWVKIHGTASY